MFIYVYYTFRMVMPGAMPMSLSREAFSSVTPAVLDVFFSSLLLENAE